MKDIEKTESNAEYYHQTQSCRIKTYGLEQVLIQHRFLFQDVNCIEKSGTNANSGAKDEAIVFTMRRGGKTFIFGQVATISTAWSNSLWNIYANLGFYLVSNLCKLGYYISIYFHDIRIFMWHCLKVSDRDFVVEKLCELLSRLCGSGEDSSSITSSGSSPAFSTGWVLHSEMADTCINLSD